MFWRCKEPGHQQPWYWLCWTKLILFLHIKGWIFEVLRFYVWINYTSFNFWVRYKYNTMLKFIRALKYRSWCTFFNAPRMFISSLVHWLWETINWFHYDTNPTPTTNTQCCSWICWCFSSFSSQCFQMPWCSCNITLDMGSANERRRYNVTSSLIGWSHTNNDPGLWCHNETWLYFV